jgi:hypothetical protein
MGQKCTVPAKSKNLAVIAHKGGTLARVHRGTAEVAPFYPHSLTLHLKSDK